MIKKEVPSDLIKNNFEQMNCIYKPFLTHYNMYKPVIIAIILLMFSLQSPAKEVVVKNVKGRAVIANITPEQAKEIAIMEAKKKALRKAGISEHIVASDVLNTSGTNEEMKNTFNSISTVEISGEVIDYVIINETRGQDEFDNFYFEVTIDATVIKYDRKKDHSFDLSIENIEPFYKNGEPLEFRITPNKSGYLKIFLFDEKKTCSMLFPNDYEANRLFEPNKTAVFPLHPGIEYVLETLQEKETNHLVFVYLKKDIPFHEKISYRNLIRWIYSIPPDQRNVKYYNFIIQDS